MTYAQLFLLWRTGEIGDRAIAERIRADALFARWFARERRKG
jgi:hypothetical protein